MFARSVSFTLIAAIAVAFLPAAALAASHAVPGNYATIGEAIANASAGDTITVDSGTYHENVVLAKGLTLIGHDTGTGLPTIDVSSGPGIEVAADNAVLQGFRVTGASKGIYAHDCGGFKIMDCVVIGNGFGVMLSGAHGGTVMNNTITGNSNVGIDVADSTGNALYLNKVYDNQFGISLTGSSASNTVYMNSLHDNSGANGQADGQANSWNCSIPLTYGYGGRQFSNYPGNYWGNLNGQDANKDGILDTKVMLAENNGDYGPLAQPIPDRPSADFTSDGTSGVVPLPVQFTDASTGYAVSWHWDFGDGNTSDMQDPPHIYQRTGSFTVSLTVNNVHGQDKVIRSNYIVVASPPTWTPTPTAAPTATPEPWPTATPTAQPSNTPTPAPTSTPKPTPDVSPLLAASAMALAYVILVKKNER